MDADRAAIRSLLSEAARHLDHLDLDAANAQVYAVEDVVTRWNGAGRLVELLTPLMAPIEDAYVRRGAAWPATVSHALAACSD